MRLVAMPPQERLEGQEDRALVVNDDDVMRGGRTHGGVASGKCTRERRSARAESK